jgi:hypothetical protein
VDIFEFNTILTPINVGGVHWIVVMVSITEKHAQLYDPAPGQGGQNPNSRLCFDQILRFLEDEHLKKRGEFSQMHQVGVKKCKTRNFQRNLTDATAESSFLHLSIFLCSIYLSVSALALTLICLLPTFVFDLQDRS